jgi:DNA-binding CsgD family transcriptional regulator
MQPFTQAAAFAVRTSLKRMPNRYLLPADAWDRMSVRLRLSPRELQILMYVFDDQKRETIAAELAISPHTVNTYFQRLYKKLDVSSRPQLILRVVLEYLSWNTTDDLIS